MTALTTGHAELADVFFLVAVILAVLAALASSPRPTAVAPSAGACLGWLALAFTATALLVL